MTRWYQLSSSLVTLAQKYLSWPCVALRVTLRAAGKSRDPGRSAPGDRNPVHADADLADAAVCAATAAYVAAELRVSADSISSAPTKNGEAGKPASPSLRDLTALGQGRT